MWPRAGALLWTEKAVGGTQRGRSQQALRDATQDEQVVQRPGKVLGVRALVAQEHLHGEGRYASLCVLCVRHKG